MRTAIKRYLARDKEEGFTLIELMVVLLIIAILMAIAIPTFLGARNTANARSAQSNLTNGLIAEQTYWTNNQTFGASTAMSTIEPNLTWIATAPTTSSAANAVAVMATAGGVLELQAFGKDGNCYSVAQNNAPNATGTTTAYLETATTCPAAITAFPAVTQGSAGAAAGTWSSSF